MLLCSVKLLILSMESNYTLNIEDFGGSIGDSEKAEQSLVNIQQNPIFNCIYIFFKNYITIVS